MAWTHRQIIISIMQVGFGSINTISTKWADEMEAENSAGDSVQFNHPYFQTEGMFVGEILCMIAFYVFRCISRHRRRSQMELSPSDDQSTQFPKRIFMIPACCDALATSTMYMGLVLTYASSFQMLRGAVIVFTGLFSVAFLGRRLRYFQWIGIFVLISGLLVVGVSDFVGENIEGYTTNGIITGDLMIVAAQVITATQMVVEEKFVTKHDVAPLLAVGWEGVMGFTIITILLVPFYWIPGGIFSTNPRGVLEDIPDAFTQIGNNPMLLLPILGNILSISFFNFAGVSVTKELSATTRMVNDSIRTLIIWIFSLLLGWQYFQYLQLLGFLIYSVGVFLYNDVIILPLLRYMGWVNDALPEDTEPVLSSSSSGRVDEEVPGEKVGKDNPNLTVEPM
ncbi:hypothetical protein Pcinc_010441 [Petrolisthes cinctipes]|uniref:Solute carrier family 35 member F6 n=1 Tax=Petrolisthes cinctipes TaxID=88211 RepID=A0AAE1KVC7_PETCI|nr:hypothetical protein Pcinc_010441 [Petrolisthes cinctipes]